MSVRVWDRMPLECSLLYRPFDSRSLARAVPYVVVVRSTRAPVRCSPSTAEDCLPLSVPILQTTLADRRPDRQGKVRDIYEFGDRLLIVATDRISAFDYVLGSGIPDKGKVLTQISTFWFERMQPIVANHLLSTAASSFPGDARRAADLLQGRSMLVTRTEPLPIECVARGYLSGSGWKDYAATGELCGIRLPAEVRQGAPPPRPRLSPAAQAESGLASHLNEQEPADLAPDDGLHRVRAATRRVN